MIYLDYAATTPVRREVTEAMLPFLADEYGNASSIYTLGRKARSAVDDARHAIAQYVGAQDSEIIFTSGGTESIHSALFGAWLAQPEKRHIITTKVEHHAVLHTCQLLKEFGVDVTFLPTDHDGRVRTKDVLEAVSDNTLLVSIININNELGSVNDVTTLAREIHAKFPDVLVHSDMVQAAGWTPLNLDSSGIDMASFTAHKLGGPKGAGALYLRQGTAWKSVLRGGAQERERRAGTENVAAIVGFGAAIKWLTEHAEVHRQVTLERAALLRAGLDEIPDVTWNSPKDAVPYIMNLHVKGVRADRLLMRLDLEGVAASAGSACAAGSLEPSHVLVSIGLDGKTARESIRFSLSDELSRQDILQAVDIISSTVASLRHVRS